MGLKKLVSIKDIFAEFLRLEDDLQLFASKISDIRFWEYLRFPIFSLIVQKATEQETLFVGIHSKLSRIKLYLFSILNIFRNPLFSRRKTILYYCSPRRQLRQDGMWWDIYTDFLIPETGLSHLAIENHFELTHKTPPSTRNLKYLDLLDFVLYLAEKLGIKRFKFDERSRVLLKKIQREISHRFKLEVNVEIMTSKLLSARRIKRMYYKLLLRIVRPKAIVVVTSYGKESLIEVSKSLRIPIIELQHGNINPYHTAYSFPGGDREKKSFPDYLFVFGDYWTHCVEYPLDASRIVSIGYPFLEYEMKRYEHLSPKNRILVISQWTIGDRLSKFAVELSTENQAYDIIFKLHPRECSGWMERYPWLVDTDISVVDDAKTPLYELFSESSVIVGGYSTAIVEGLAFGLTTFLLDVPGIENLSYLIEHKHVEVIDSVNQMLTMLRSSLNKNEVDREFFFRKGSIERFVVSLKRIIQLRDDSI